MEAAAPSAKKRRAEALEAGKTSTPATAAMETYNPEATPIKKTGAHSSQEPPPSSAGGEQDNDNGVDHISSLPDAILGDIITLLPTKDGARTQVLAHRWRHVWRAAPLNLDCRGGGLPDDDDEALAGVVSRIVAAHRGPGRVFCVPAHHLHDRAAAVDAWLRSAALDNLQEIELCYLRLHPPDYPPRAPASMFRFSATLRVATICQCQISDHGALAGQTIRFPLLRQLGLVRVRISEASLYAMISSSGCPALEYLFLDSIHGFRRVRINSTSLRSIGVRTDYYDQDRRRFRKLVIEDAPRLEKLLCTQREAFHLEVSVMAAPKLETLGSLSNWGSNRSIHVFGSTVFQELRLVSFTSVVCGVKVLSVDLLNGNLDMVIDLLKCFPCLEKLYIKGCISTAGDNRWRRKHKHLIQCFDIHLKTLVLERYQGIKSHIRFASFFLLNAKELELMRLEVEEKKCNEKFFAEQRLKLQVEGWAPGAGGARLDFGLHRCHCRIIHIDHVRDLAIADPFDCTC